MESKHQGQRAGKWKYRDAAGNLIALVLRYNLPSPEGEKPRKTFRPVSRWDDAWHLCDPERWPLYNLAALAEAGQVFVVEGEKCCDALADLGITATTSAHGSQSPHKTDWTPLAGKYITLLPDDDEAGGKYATAVVEILGKLSPAPKVMLDSPVTPKE
jgi:hypothetical protein